MKVRAKTSSFSLGRRKSSASAIAPSPEGNCRKCGQRFPLNVEKECNWCAEITAKDNTRRMLNFRPAASVSSTKEREAFFPFTLNTKAWNHRELSATGQGKAETALADIYQAQKVLQAREQRRILKTAGPPQEESSFGLKRLQSKSVDHRVYSAPAGEASTDRIDCQFIRKAVLRSFCLKSMLIADRNLNTIPDHAVSTLAVQLGNVLAFRFPRNRIRSLKKQEFEDLEFLRELDLSYNAIAALPSSIGHLVKLHRLLMDANRLKELPEELLSLRQLQELHLSKNRFSALPDSTGRLHSLRVLNVSYNEILAFPITLHQLTQLSHLDCSFNELSYVAFVPQECLPPPLSEAKQDNDFAFTTNSDSDSATSAFSGSERQKELECELTSDDEDSFTREISGYPAVNDKLKEQLKLPLDSIKKTSNTAAMFIHSVEASGATAPVKDARPWKLKLNSDSNKVKDRSASKVAYFENVNTGEIVTTIPKFYDKISLLKNLSYLDLSYNRLSCLPSTIRELPKIEVLKLDGNRFHNFPSDALLDPPIESLKELRLANNFICAIPEKIYYLPSIRTLDLSRNRIRAFPFIDFLEFKIEPGAGRGQSSITKNDRKHNSHDLNELSMRSKPLPSATNGRGKPKTPKIEGLDVDHQGDGDRPPSHGQEWPWPKLEYFSLAENLLEEIPEGIAYLTKAKDVTLFGNPLQSNDRAVVTKDLQQLLWFCRQKILRRRQGLEPKAMVLKKGIDGERSIPEPKFNQDVNVAVAEGECVNEAETYCNRCRHSFCSSCFWKEHEEDSQGNIAHKLKKDGTHQMMELDKTKDKAYQFRLNQRHRLKGLLSARNNNTQKSGRPLTIQCSPRQAHSSRADLEDSLPHVDFSSEAILCRKGSGVVNLGWASLSHWPSRFHQCRMLHTVVLDGNDLKKLLDVSDFHLDDCTTLRSTENSQEYNGVQDVFMNNRSNSHQETDSTRGGRSGGRGRGRGKGRDLSLLPGIGQRGHPKWIDPESVTTSSQMSTSGSEQQTSLHIGQAPQKSTNSKKFPMLYKIKHLSLRSCRLRDLPDFVTLFGSLRELQLENNCIHKLPVSLGDLIHLRQLSLNGNQLHELPESLGNLQSLQVLEIENNKLIALPKSIGRLTALQFLSVNVNKLSALPDEIGQLESLCCFRVMRNKLSATPPGLERLSNLEELNLSYNQIEELSEAFVQSPYLSKSINTFSIYGNNIVDLHPAIHRFSQLKILGLSHNPLRSPPKEMGELPVADILLYCKEREERLEQIKNALSRCSCVELNNEGILKYTTKACITDSWGFLTNRDRHEIDQLVDHYINANFRSYTVSCDEIINRIVVRHNSRRHEVYENILFALARLLPHIGVIGPPPKHLSQHIEFQDLDLMQSTKEKRKLRKREQARQISTAETSLQSQAKGKRKQRRKDRDDSSTDEDDGWWAARKIRKQREKEQIHLEQIQQERLQRKQTLKRKLTLAGVNQEIRLTKKGASALIQTSRSFRSAAGHSQMMSFTASDSSSFSAKRSIVGIDGGPMIPMTGANLRRKGESVTGKSDNLSQRDVGNRCTSEVELSAFSSLSLGTDITHEESRNQGILPDCEEDWNSDDEEDTLERVIRLCRRPRPAPMRYTVIDLDAVLENCWETEKCPDEKDDEASVVALHHSEEYSPTSSIQKPKDRTIEAEFKESDLELGPEDDQIPGSALPNKSNMVQGPDLTIRQHEDYFCPPAWPIPVPSSCFEHISLLTYSKEDAKASFLDRGSPEFIKAEQTEVKNRGPFNHRWTLRQLPRIPPIPVSIPVKRLSLVALLQQHLSFLETSITKQVLLDALTVHEGPLGVAAALRPTSAREARAGNRIEQIIISSTESHGRRKTKSSRQALVIPQLLLTMEQQERKLQEDDRIMTEVDAKVDEIVEYFFQHNENGFLDRFAIRRKKEAKKRLKPLKRQLAVEEKKMKELSEIVSIAQEEGEDVSDEDTQNLSGMREDVEEKRSIVAGLTKICKQNREQNAIDLAADLFAIACSQRYDKIIRSLRRHAYRRRLLRPWDDDYASLVEEYDKHMLKWKHKHRHKLTMPEFVIDTSTDMDGEEKEEEVVRKELLKFQTQESLEVQKGSKTWQAVRKLRHSGGREKRLVASALSEVEEEDANSGKVAYSYWGTVLEDILIPRSKAEMEERQTKRRERLQEKKRLLERKIAERKEQARKERMREKLSALTKGSFTGSSSHAMNDDPQLRLCKTSQGNFKYTKFSLQFSLMGRKKKISAKENKGQSNDADKHPSAEPISVGDVVDNVQVAQDSEQEGPVASGDPQAGEGSQTDKCESESSVVNPSSFREESDSGLSESRTEESSHRQDTDLSDGVECVQEGSEGFYSESTIIQESETGVIGARSEESTGISGVDIDDDDGIAEALDSASESDSSDRPQSIPDALSGSQSTHELEES